MRQSGRLTEVERDAAVLDLQRELREVRAVLFAMAHEVAQTGAGGSDTCLRAVLARVAPMPVEAVVDQAG